GVALGEGMVFVSRLDGAQVALDQETGKVLWSTDVVRPRSGFSITSAPLYYEGRVYVGGSGGEYGVRGRLTALDARTGKENWRFYTTPSPQELWHWQTGAGANTTVTPFEDEGEEKIAFYAGGNSLAATSHGETSGSSRWTATSRRPKAWKPK